MTTRQKEKRDEIQKRKSNIVMMSGQFCTLAKFKSKVKMKTSVEEGAAQRSKLSYKKENLALYGKLSNFE